MEDRTFKDKDKAKDWWHRNKRVIKVGIACAFTGTMYGFIKGMATTDKMLLDHGFERAEDDSDMPCDELGLTEVNCDDPEGNLFEVKKLIAFGNKIESNT